MKTCKNRWVHKPRDGYAKKEKKMIEISNNEIEMTVFGWVQQWTGHSQGKKKSVNLKI